MLDSFNVWRKMHGLGPVYCPECEGPLTVLNLRNTNSKASHCGTMIYGTIACEICKIVNIDGWLNNNLEGYDFYLSSDLVSYGYNEFERLQRERKESCTEKS